MMDVAWLSGAWSVRRRIVDHRARSTYVFTGRAFSTSSGFRETGSLRIADRELEAARSYGLAPFDQGIDVSHPDGSHFLRLGLNARQSVRHVCGEDTYTGQFLFRSADVWAEFWRVQGPRKRYASLSLYERSSSGS